MDSDLTSLSDESTRSSRSSSLSPPPPEPLSSFFTINPHADSFDNELLADLRDIALQLADYDYQQEPDFTDEVNQKLAAHLITSKKSLPNYSLNVSIGGTNDVRLWNRGPGQTTWAATSMQSEIRDRFSASTSARIGNYRPDLYVYVRLRTRKDGPIAERGDGRVISLVGEDGIIKRLPSGKFGVVPSVVSSRVSGASTETNDFDSLDQAFAAVWRVKLARLLLYVITARQMCGCRIGLLRIHHKFCRIWYLNDFHVAIEVTEHFSIPEGNLASDFLNHWENANHMPYTWDQTVSQVPVMFMTVSAALRMLGKLPLQLPLPELKEDPKLTSLSSASRIHATDVIAWRSRKHPDRSSRPRIHSRPFKTSS